MCPISLNRASGVDITAEQALVEHQILSHVALALRLGLDWRAETAGLPRERSSVKFTALSYERHIERIMTLEEEGGYLKFVREQQPELYDKVKALRREHDEFRRELAAALRGLDELTDDDMVAFDALCGRLIQFLDRVDAHHTHEIDLIQEAMRDVGGEG